MSYSIFIGQAVATWPEREAQEKWGDTEPGWEVEGVSLEHAPEFPGDTMTGKGNGRHPGYGSWGAFLDAVGLRDLFNGEEGLMRRHPGCFALRGSDLERVRAALKKHEERFPDAVPGWCSCRDCDFPRDAEQPPHRPELATDESGNRARLLWLAFWMEYALTQCERPAIYNR